MLLITGANGYIGSHFLIEVINSGLEYIAIDNFSRSNPDTLIKVEKITNNKINFVEGDIGNEGITNKLFSDFKIDSVVHFAGFKSMVESIESPLIYYKNNVSKTISLIQQMEKHDIHNIIFSSSATVYGGELKSPIHEDNDLRFPLSSYAQSKLFIEQVLKKMSQGKSKWNVGVLRYFNPIGCHHSGLIGENNNEKASNLIPAIINVILKIQPYLEVYGNDFNTRDGTGIRDYLHIEDLVEGHIRALDYIIKNGGYNVWNLGSGKGYSVLEIINAFEKQLKHQIPIIYKPRRLGDVDEYWADVRKANKELAWVAARDIQLIVEDILRYAATLNK